MKKPDQSRIVEFIIVFSVLYLAICIGLYLGQRSLLYFPDRKLSSPQEYGLKDFAERTFTTEDEVRIIAWYKAPASSENPLIVYFHGNGGNLSYRAERYGILANNGAGVLALSYRGYGTSEGNPSEEGFYKDARVVMKFANSRSGRIFLYGESLGSGIAVQMATEYNIDKLILEAPFTSVPDRAQEIYFWLPAKWMVKDKFDNFSKIKNIDAPLLLIHGGMDNVVPIRHGRKLFAEAREPKKSIFMEKQDHVIEITGEIFTEIFR